MQCITILISFNERKARHDMVELEELKNYVADNLNKGLVSIAPLYEIPTEDDGYNLFNTKLVEVYNFATEKEADDLINTVKNNQQFYSVSKKFKEPKMDKHGELVKEGYFIVKITYIIKY